VADATATTALMAAVLPAPPQSDITLRQFRIQGNPIYDIVKFQPNVPSFGLSTITLNRPMAEQGGAGLSYQVYQPYMPAPAIDFKRWLSIVDPISGYRFRYRNIFKTTKELDRRDPQRTSFGWPTVVCGKDYVTVGNDTQQRPRFELGLGQPTQAIGYILGFMVTGAVSLNSTGYVTPQQISDATIMARARYYGHDLVGNQPNVDVKVKSFHTAKMRVLEAQFADLLMRDKQQDNAIFDSQVTDEPDGPELSGPLDSDYMQDHVLYWTS
jgi:hypothetical protein